MKTGVKSNIFSVKLGQDLENTFPDEKAVDLWISLDRRIVFGDFFVRVT